MEDVGSLLAVTAATEAEATAEKALEVAEEASAKADEAVQLANETPPIVLPESSPETESPEASLMDLLMSHIEGDSLYCQGVDERLTGIETRLDELAMSVASLATATAVVTAESAPAVAEASTAETVEEPPVEPLTVEVSDTPSGLRVPLWKRLLLTDR